MKSGNKSNIEHFECMKKHHTCNLVRKQLNKFSRAHRMKKLIFSFSIKLIWSPNWEFQRIYKNIVENVNNERYRLNVWAVYCEHAVTVIKSTKFVYLIFVVSEFFRLLLRIKNANEWNGKCWKTIKNHPNWFFKFWNVLIFRRLYRKCLKYAKNTEQLFLIYK